MIDAPRMSAAQRKRPVEFRLRPPATGHQETLGVPRSTSGQDPLEPFAAGSFPALHFNPSQRAFKMCALGRWVLPGIVCGQRPS